MAETEEAFPQEDPGVPKGTHLEEQMSSTKWETGSALVQGVETRTLPGEQNAASIRPRSLKASSHHPFHLRVVTVAEVPVVACRDCGGPGCMLRGGCGGDRSGFRGGQGMDRGSYDGGRRDGSGGPPGPLME